jgi:fumarylacetoacetase
VSDAADFTPANLPFGVANRPGWRRPHVVVAIGDDAVDCHAAMCAGRFTGLGVPSNVFTTGSLNGLLELGRPAVSAVRDRVADLLDDPSLLLRRSDLTMLMPIEVADFVDHYASEHHARNLGRILRPGEPPLALNWKHLPVGYHGRAGSVVVSGTEVRRPMGLIARGEEPPTYCPTDRLDLELEVGAVVGRPSTPGVPVDVDSALDHVAGLVLLNDWSARDIQAFEYRPLGPNQGKSFATSISPWLVTLDALEPFRIQAPPRDTPAAPHLREGVRGAFDLQLEVAITTAAMRRDGCPPAVLSGAGFAGMYWTIGQQLAHLTANGAAARTGDLLGSGTVSGAAPHEVGSLIELTEGGTEPISLPNGEWRSFLEDGDEVVLRGWAGEGDRRVGFGSVSGIVGAARTPGIRE